MSNSRPSARARRVLSPSRETTAFAATLCGVAQELLRPGPCPGRQLEDLAARAELVERGLDLNDVAPPAGVLLRAVVEQAAPEPPVVVLGRALPVVALLLVDQPLRGRLVDG